MPSAPEDAFPLQLMHGAVVSEAAGIVLDGLPPGAFATSDASAEHGALIIGLHSQDGPTSLLDIRIGQVSQPWDHNPNGATCSLSCGAAQRPWLTHNGKDGPLASPASIAHELRFLSFQSMQLNAQRMLACARCKLWWMTPEWRTSTLQLPPETQFLLVELKSPGGGGDGDAAASDGAYALLLPLIDGDYRTTLRAGR